MLDDRRVTPVHTLAGGQNYIASPKFVLFGHHFAAIAGAGPLIGLTLAALFMIGLVLVVAAAARRSVQTLNGVPVPAQSLTAQESLDKDVKIRCC